jgi:hypothetical protein
MMGCLAMCKEPRVKVVQYFFLETLETRRG